MEDEELEILEEDEVEENKSDDAQKEDTKNTKKDTKSSDKKEEKEKSNEETKEVKKGTFRERKPLDIPVVINSEPDVIKEVENEAQEISRSVTNDELAYELSSRKLKKIIGIILVILLIVDLLTLAAYLIGFDKVFSFIK